MYAYEPKLNNKRQHGHDNDDDQPTESKYQRLATHPYQPMEIMDLENLDLHNLFNVAITNEYLRPAAATVYKRKFGNIEVNIQNHGLELTDHGNWINAFGLNMCHQYLRCFGASISNLCIRYEPYDRIYYCWKENEYAQIHQHLNEYCAESMVKIEFLGKPAKLLIKHFEKPFINVHTVRVTSGDLNDQFSSFPQWFPNVRSLELTGIDISSCNIKTPFHQLQDLRIDFHRDKCRDIEDERFIHLLRMCYRLKCFKLIWRGRYGRTFNTLLNFIEGNPMIHNLTVSMTRCSMTVSPIEIERIVNEHSALAELNLNGFEFTAEDAIRLIKELHSLKKFSFKLNNQPEYERFVAKVNSKTFTVSGNHQHVLYEMARPSN